MFFDEDPSLNSMDESIFKDHCSQRAEAGYNSGMGEIFRKVAAISPVKLSTACPAEGICPKETETKVELEV